MKKRENWTDEETRLLVKLNEAGMGKREIAKIVGHTFAGTRDKLRRIQDCSDNVREAVEIVSRKCLRCRDPFEAEGRFIRICGRCKDLQEWKRAGVLLA